MTGPKVDLVVTLGATYLLADEHKLGHGLIDELGHIDIAIAATGYAPLSLELADTVGTNGVVVLTIGPIKLTLPHERAAVSQN